MSTNLNTIQFHEENVSFVQDDKGEVYVPIRERTEAIGLDWKSQHRKLSTGKQWSVVIMTTVAQDGKSREMVCLPLRKFDAWVMSIDSNKVKPELRERLEAYQNELSEVLWAYRSKGIAVNPEFGHGAPSAAYTGHPSIPVETVGFRVTLVDAEHQPWVGLDSIQERLGLSSLVKGNARATKKMSYVESDIFGMKRLAVNMEGITCEMMCAPLHRLPVWLDHCIDRLYCLPASDEAKKLRQFGPNMLLRAWNEWKAPQAANVSALKQPDIKVRVSMTGGLVRELAKLFGEEGAADYLRSFGVSMGQIQAVSGESYQAAAKSDLPPVTVAVPPLSYRDATRKLVAQYARRMNFPHDEVWNKLYDAVYYRLHVNLKARGKAHGVSGMEAAEAMGAECMAQVFSLAEEMFG